MPTVQVGSTTVAYAVTGSGPAIMLIHGAGASKDTNWGALAGLEERFTLVALDLPGSGDTRDSGGTLDHDELARLAAAVVEQTKVGSAHVVGYSMGSTVAIRLAATRPELVRSLVLVAGWAHSDVRMVHEFDLWRRLFETDRELWVRFTVLTGSGPEFFASVDQGAIESLVGTFLSITPDGVGRQAELITRIDVRSCLADVRAPTLIVGLEHDQQVPVEHARTLHQGIAGSEYQEIASGHLVPWHHPQAFAEAIGGFVTRQPEGRQADLNGPTL